MADIQRIASVAAPTLTPLGPAAVLIQGLHDGLVISGMDPNVAWFPAIFSGCGMELTGFLASKMTVRAIKNGDWQSGIVAALGIVGYVIFAIIGIQHVPNSQMFQSFVGMSTIAYFAYGVYEWMTTKDEKALKNATSTLELDKQRKALELEYNERMAKIERERQEMEHKKRLDEIRLAKATNGQKVKSSSRPNGQLDKTKLDWLREFMKSNPEKQSLADIVAADGCPFTSRETARKYRAAL